MIQEFIMKNIDVIVKENKEKVLPYVFINQTQDVHVTVRLTGDGASVHIVGIFLSNRQNATTFNTTVIHESSHTKSRTELRGVFFDRASFNNDGMITIIKGAKGADGFFSSKILLFDNAKGRSVPSLEIDENEVKAGHASTVGRPDENQLFYLRSRGLSEKEAEKLIISGFFEPIMQYFLKDEREKVKKKIGKII